MLCPGVATTWTAILLSLRFFHYVHAVDKGSVTYHRTSPSRQDSAQDSDHHVDLPSGYVHQVPAAFHPQPARAYPGDLSDFLLPPPAPIARKRMKVPGSRRTVSRADLEPVAKPEANPEVKPSQHAQAYAPDLASSINLPAYSAPEGSSNRFIDTEAEFSFNGAGFLPPEDGSKSKDGKQNSEREDQRPGASVNSPQRLRHRNPLAQSRPLPFGVPLLSSADALHLAQSAPAVNYYQGLPSVTYPGFPEFGFRQKREAVLEESSKPKKMHKTIKLYLHRMLMNKSLVAKPKKTTHLDKMVKLDTKMQAAASEYHSNGFQASYPYFRNSPGYAYEETSSRDSLRVRDRRPNRHQLYATETRSYGYGHDNLGSGNFEIIRGGIFSDGHAASQHNPVQSASYGGGGDGDGYDYDDDEGEPILGFQGYNNFGSLHNALASRKRVTAIPIAGRRSSSGHSQSHESQLIPMNTDLLAMD